MGFLKWGFLPSWAKDEKMASKMINASSETVDENRVLKNPFSNGDVLFRWTLLRMERGEFESPDANKDER